MQPKTVRFFHSAAGAALVTIQATVQVPNGGNRDWGGGVRSGVQGIQPEFCEHLPAKGVSITLWAKVDVQINRAGAGWWWWWWGWVFFVFFTDLTHELFPAMQVGGPENVVPFQWFQQKVVPNAGDTVRGVRGLGRAGGPEVGAETLGRLFSPHARQFFKVVRFVPRPPIT